MTTEKNPLEWAARWIEDSLKGETNQRVIEFGNNMAMTIRAAALPVAHVSGDVGTGEAGWILERVASEPCHRADYAWSGTCEADAGHDGHYACGPCLARKWKANRSAVAGPTPSTPDTEETMKATYTTAHPSRYLLTHGVHPDIVVLFFLALKSHWFEDDANMFYGQREQAKAYLYKWVETGEMADDNTTLEIATRMKFREWLESSWATDSEVAPSSVREAARAAAEEWFVLRGEKYPDAQPAIAELAAIISKHVQPREDAEPRVERLQAQLNGTLNCLAESQKEVERLRRGEFTPDEFQQLCHNLSETDREAFFQGCSDYQRKLFGVAQVDLPANQQRVEMLHCSCGAACTPEEYEQHVAMGHDAGLLVKSQKVERRGDSYEIKACPECRGIGKTHRPGCVFPSAELVQPEGYAHFKVGDNLRSIHEPGRQPVAVTEVAGWELPRVAESVQSAGERIRESMGLSEHSLKALIRRENVAELKSRIDAAIVSAERDAIAKERERCALIADNCAKQNHEGAVKAIRRDDQGTYDVLDSCKREAEAITFVIRQGTTE